MLQAGRLFRAGRGGVGRAARRGFCEPGASEGALAYRHIVGLLAAQQAPSAAKAAASALASVTRRHGARDARFYARLLGNARGLAEAWSGNGGEALRALEAAYRETVVGTNHDAFLDIGGLLNDLAVQHGHAAGGGEAGPKAWDFVKAEATLKRALYLSERAYRADGDLVAATLTNLGELHFWRGDAERGLTFHARALQLLDVDSFLGAVQDAPSVTDAPDTHAADPVLRQSLGALRESRRVLSRGAAGRALALLNEDAGSWVNGRDLVNDGLHEARMALPAASPLLHFTLGALRRDAALVAMLQPGADAMARSGDGDKGGSAPPSEHAMLALAHAVAASVVEGNGEARLPVEHQQTLETNNLAGLEACIDYLLANESAVVSTHSVRAAIWLLAWALPVPEARALLAQLRPFIQGEGAGARAFHDLDAAARDLEVSAGPRAAAAFDMPETLAVAVAAQRETADPLATGAAVRKRMLRNMLRSDEDRDERLLWGAGARGVGLRDCNPRALAWSDAPSAGGLGGAGGGVDGEVDTDGGRGPSDGGKNADSSLGGFHPYAL